MLICKIGTTHQGLPTLHADVTPSQQDELKEKGRGRLTETVSQVGTRVFLKGKRLRGHLSLITYHSDPGPCGTSN